MFANFTLVGTGPGVVGSGGGFGMMLRRGTGGYYVNGIVARWPNAAIALRNNTTAARIAEGNLVIRNLLLAENAGVFEAAGGITVDAAANGIEAADRHGGEPVHRLPGRRPERRARPSTGRRPPARRRGAGGTGAFTGALAAKAGTFVTGTGYRGAVDPAGAKWWQGWTTYARN